MRAVSLILLLAFFSFSSYAQNSSSPAPKPENSSTKTSQTDQEKFEQKIKKRVEELIKLINQEPNLLAVNPKARVVKDPNWKPYTPDGRKNQDFKVVPDDSDPKISQALRINQNRQLWAEELVRIGAIAVPQIIEAVLDDGNKYRQYLVWALGEIKDLRAVPCLLHYYDEALAQEKLAKSLEKMGVPEEPQKLRQEAQLKRKYATEALKKISGKDFGDDYQKWEQWWKQTGSKIPGAKLKKPYEAKGAKPPSYKALSPVPNSEQK